MVVEKVGIIREGCLLVLGEMFIELIGVFVVELLDLVLTRGVDFGVWGVERVVGGQLFELWILSGSYDGIFFLLYGDY